MKYRVSYTLLGARDHHCSGLGAPMCDEDSETIVEADNPEDAKRKVESSDCAVNRVEPIEEEICRFNKSH